MNTGVFNMEEVSWFECDNESLDSEQRKLYGRDMAYSYAWSMLQLGYRTTVIRSGGVYGVKVTEDFELQERKLNDVTVH